MGFPPIIVHCLKATLYMVTCLPFCLIKNISQAQAFLAGIVNIQLAVFEILEIMSLVVNALPSLKK